MPYSFVVFPTPLDAHVVLSPDSGASYVCTPTTDAVGRPGQGTALPDATPSGHGATLELSAAGYQYLRVRGFLVLEGNTARLQVDDYTLNPILTPEPTPPPQTGGSPQEIIQRVYDTTHPNLATIDGCGKFTEDCCTALHEQHSQGWGHIDKDPGQNQYNGHAVDAVQLLAAVGSTSPGIYDIIFSSASPEAKPVFNYVSPPNYDDWVYPAGAATRGAAVVLVSGDTIANLGGIISGRRLHQPHVVH